MVSSGNALLRLQCNSMPQGSPTQIGDALVELKLELLAQSLRDELIDRMPLRFAQSLWMVKFKMNIISVTCNRKREARLGVRPTSDATLNFPVYVGKFHSNSFVV